MAEDLRPSDPKALLARARRTLRDAPLPARRAVKGWEDGLAFNELIADPRQDPADPRYEPGA